jgi:hypothetical protein
MRSTTGEKQLAKDCVNRHQHTLFGNSPFKERPIARIRSVIFRLDIVTLLAQPTGDSATGASVNEKPHQAVTRIASSVSFYDRVCVGQSGADVLRLQLRIILHERLD